MENQATVASIPRASVILGALEALRNGQAALLVGLVFIATALVFALFSFLSAIGGLIFNQTRDEVRMQEYLGELNQRLKA